MTKIHRTTTSFAGLRKSSQKPSASYSLMTRSRFPSQTKISLRNKVAVGTWDNAEGKQKDIFACRVISYRILLADIRTDYIGLQICARSINIQDQTTRFCEPFKHVFTTKEFVECRHLDASMRFYFLAKGKRDSAAVGEDIIRLRV